MNALSILNDYLNKKHDEIGRLEKKLPSLPINLVQEAFPIGMWGTWWDMEFEFTLPMSVELLENFKEFCAYQGYELGKITQHVWSETNAGYFTDLTIA